MSAFFQFVINLITRTKEKYRKRWRLKFCGIVHCLTLKMTLLVYNCFGILRSSGTDSSIGKITVCHCYVKIN